jgi:uncharacterized membrane protein
MGGLIVLGALVVLGIPVAVVVLLVSVSGLKRRVEGLEREVRALRLAGPVTDAETAESAAPSSDATLPAGSGAEPPGARPPTPEGSVPDDRGESVSPGPWAAATHAPGAGPDAGAPFDIPESRDPPPAPRGPSPADRLGAWLKANWVYAVSALSLALAGIFFVQYGIENGLLPPPLRVLASILFGLALIAGGELVRRRGGDEGEGPTAYLPSTFSGAGVVAIFAGILAARQLYDLIGPGPAMAGLVATAAGAVVLGWFYGPFLAAIGLIGATAAPFVVGGASDSPEWLFGYFALVAAFGLGVDTMRRWAWVSALSVVLAFAGGWLLALSGVKAEWFAAYLCLLPLLAIAIPARSLWPDQAGPTLTEAITRAARLQSARASLPPGMEVTGAALPGAAFPTQLAAGTVAAASASLFLLPGWDMTAATAAFVAPAALAILLVVWTARAPALADLAAMPAIAFLVRIATESTGYGALYQGFRAADISLRAPETQGPATATVLIALGAGISVAAIWRSLREGGPGGRFPAVWAAGAALTGPVAALMLELFWQPALVIGAYPWALHVIALAALMTGAALAFARQSSADHRRPAYAALAALSLIALALFLILAEAALTVALAILLVVAAVLDRRFRLPEMGWFAQAAVLVLGWRLTIDPGLDWAFRADWAQLVVAFAAAVAGMGAAYRMFGAERTGARVFLEGGIAAYAAIFVNVAVTRLIEARIGGGFVVSYWSVAMNALPWLIVALVQLHRMQLKGRVMTWVRGGIAVVAGLIAVAGIGAAVTALNPLLSPWTDDPSARVYGPLVLDTLFLAYAVPGLVLILAARRLGHLGRWPVMALTGAGAALGALYAGLEIRRFWRGDVLGVPGTSQAELYSYTLALLILGAVLLYQAIARRSQGLRRIAMAVIALTIAKVFLIDASGLSGLTRVFSFLGLGLALAGLAWLNRWAAGRQGGGQTGPAGG